ncbi:MAG: hypothetical protein KGI27_11305 [Thaumarchaeota archaeon]|nr:hypothetical protein [Nitrososphaerota archaeon]
MTNKILPSLMIGTVLALTVVSPNFVFAAPTGSWSTAAPIPSAREGYGAAQVGSINYYVAGDGPSGDSNTIQRYNASSNTWLSDGAPMPGPVRAELAAVSQGGHVYAVGGRPAGVVMGGIQRYDPASDTWTPFSGPGALNPMPTPVVTEHTVVVQGEKIYVIGGRDALHPAPQTGGDVNLLQIYDIPSNSWSMGVNLPFTLSDAYAVVHGDKIYVFGGFSTDPSAPAGQAGPFGFGKILNSTLIYDIAKNKWSTGASMPTHTADETAGTCGDKIHVVGGGPVFSLTGNHYVYNPAADSWSTSTAMPGITGETQTISTGGQLFIVGGGIFGSGTFNPVQNIWTCG